jgi:hypothetical protein
MNPFKTFFYSFKKSLLETKYYDEVAKVNFWFSFKYLFCLLFLITFIKMLIFSGFYLGARSFIQPGVNKVINYAQTIYPNDFKISIKNGQLVTNIKEPYVLDIKDNKIEGKRHFLIIDTKGNIENYPSYDSYILATRNAVVYPSKSSKNEVGETSIFYFNNIKKNISLDKKTYDKFINMVKPYSSKAHLFVDWAVLALSPFALIFGSLFWTIGTLFCLVFLTFFVWLVNLLFKKQYSFGSLYKMGIHASTWPIVIGILLPHFYSWIFLGWMMVILFSDKNKRISKKLQK